MFKISQFTWQTWTKVVGYIDKLLSTISVLALALIIDQKAHFNFFTVGDSTLPKEFKDVISDNPTHWIFWTAVAVLSVILLIEDSLSRFLNKGLALDGEPFKALDYMRMWGIVNVFRIFRDGFCIYTFGYVWVGLTIILIRLCFLCIITLCTRKTEGYSLSKDLESGSVVTGVENIYS